MSKRVQTVGMLLALTSMAIGGGNSAYAGTVTSLNEAQDVKQDAQCKGVVVDAAGEPVVGATVLVKGKTGVGTVTDIDGNFSLKNVTKGDVIRISYLGMTTAEVVYNGNPLKVTLKDELQGPRRGGGDRPRHEARDQGPRLRCH